MTQMEVMKFLVVVLVASAMSAAAQTETEVDSSPDAVRKWFNEHHNAEEKLTEIHFFLQDSVSGENPSAVEIARANMTDTSPGLFGLMRVFDDPLTETKDPKSKSIGFGQGTYTLTSRTELTILFTLNFVFTEGEFKGSSISVQGHNPLGNKFREMVVIGGSGVFRLARGSAVLSTAWNDPETHDGTVEFNLFVKYYPTPAAYI